MSIPVAMSWSGGKGSALALESLLRNANYEVVALLSTLTSEYQWVAMHGIRRELLVRQSQLAGLPLVGSWISSSAANDEYEQAMAERFIEFRDDGITSIAFGDLFLEDTRAYRERLVARCGMTPIFPIWGRDTSGIARQFVKDGFKALTCCVDTAVLRESFCGRELTDVFLHDLPDVVDPCGENGEFHTFVFDSPFFRERIDVRVGSSRRHGQSVFRDIIELNSPTPNT